MHFAPTVFKRFVSLTQENDAPYEGRKVDTTSMANRAIALHTKKWDRRII
jgi:hypothetical protein